MKKSTTIVEISSILLIILYIYTAGSKLVDLDTTYSEMNNQPFPNWMTPYLVWGISIAELLVAVSLIFERTRKAGLWGSLILMSVFTVYIAAILLHFFKRVPCSCGGVIKELGWTNHLYFNLFFLAISALSLVNIRRHRKEDQFAQTQQVIFT